MDESSELVAKMSGVRTAFSVSPVKAIKRKVQKPPRPSRRLRVYALDPSVGKSLDSITVNETTLSIPWDDKPSTIEPLRPGPVGEYLEVVDVDPGSNKIYDPVDLNDEQLLAQDYGLPPKATPSSINKWSTRSP